MTAAPTGGTEVPELTIPPTSTAGVNPSSPAAANNEEAELQQFIAAHSLRDHLDAAIAIARESFPAGSDVTVRLQYLPEDDGGARLVVDVRTKSSVSEAVRCHQHLLDRWTLELPLHAQALIGSTFCSS
jgi:hypothetical protein